MVNAINCNECYICYVLLLYVIEFRVNMNFVVPSAGFVDRLDLSVVMLDHS